METLLPVLLPLVGYLSGSLPFSVWITRFARGVDVRAAGSGHATATNTIRQAGFGWGALVMVLDIAKGYFPIWLAFHLLPNDILFFGQEIMSLDGQTNLFIPGQGILPVGTGDTLVFGHNPNLPFIIPIIAAFTVIGHCWPVFARFRGGMGLACLGGALLAVNALDFLIALGLLIILVLLIRHGARASVVLGVSLAPFLWLLGRGYLAVWISAAAGLVIAFRFLIDWNRKYRELWLDRETHS